MDFTVTEPPEKIPEILGLRLTYLSFLVKDKPPFSYPLMGWLKAEDDKWHRFFIDAHLLHWREYEEEEMKEVMEEDFEEGEFDGAFWVIRDLFREFNLGGKTIADAQRVYFEKGPWMCCQLQIKFEDGPTILLNDYGDEEDPELLITNGVLPE
ncbi:MAG: hypothetical protein AAFR61_05375 [Bacteroidota bacterium]